MSAVIGRSWAPPVVRRRHDEADLQAAVMAFLRSALPPDAVANHAPGEGKRSKAAQAALVRSGYRKGWPDIEVVWRGRAYFIELKAAHGIMSAAQRETHRQLVYAGAEVMVCKSVEQVEAALREAGMRLRGTVLAA